MLDNSIIGVGGGEVINNEIINLPIEQRHTEKGKPSAISHFGVPLNNRQQKLLKVLENYDSKITVNKRYANMKDLSALTAVTGDEFAMFTKGQQRLIIRGNSYSVNVNTVMAERLNKQGYRWSGHTHPGTEKNFALPSDDDIKILKQFEQETSVIYNSLGHFIVFGK